MQTTLSEIDTKLSMRRIARRACAGQYRYGGRGRTDIRRGVTTSTPVCFRNDSSAPKLVGLPYWKTTISNGAFSRTLYTGGYVLGRWESTVAHWNHYAAAFNRVKI